MKTIKLLGIFIIILAMVVGVVYLSKYLKTGGSTGNGPGNPNYFKEILDKIDREWKNTDDWSRKHFEDTRDYLSVRKKKIGQGYSTLVEHFQVKALTCLHDATVEQFATVTCRREMVDSLENDMKYFKRQAPMQKEEEKLKDLEGIHAIYDRAYSLINKNLGLTPRFDKTNRTWQNFSAHEQGIQNERRGIQTDVNYRYISQISEIQTGLAGIDERLGRAKTNFQAALVSEIEMAYRTSVDAMNRTTFNMHQLEAARRQLKMYEEEKNGLLRVEIEFGKQFGKGALKKIVDDVKKAFRQCEMKLKDTEQKYEDWKKNNN